MALDRDEGGAGICLPLWRMSSITACGVESGRSRLCTGVALACNGTPRDASFCAAVLIAPPFPESSCPPALLWRNSQCSFGIGVGGMREEEAANLER